MTHSLFVIQVHADSGTQVAIRDSLEEAIAFRKDLNALGYFGIDIKEVCKDGKVIEHPLVEVKHGDPLRLYRLLEE